MMRFESSWLRPFSDFQLFDLKINRYFNNAAIVFPPKSCKIRIRDRAEGGHVVVCFSPVFVATDNVSNRVRICTYFMFLFLVIPTRDCWG